MPVHPLKHERETRGWSQARLAEQLGVSVRTVNRWEQGQTLPYPYYREQLCILFSKSAFELGILPDNYAPAPSSALPQTREAHSSVDHSSPLLYDPLVPEALGQQKRLVGREELLQQMKLHLQTEGRPGPIALNGLPGVGKTALAAALVTDPQVQASFHDGILWASVGPHPDPLSLLVRWASLLGAMPPTGKQASQVEEWSQILRTTIGQRRLLLVLDDVWSAETAMQLQVGGPNCSYVLTTRLPQVAFAFAEQGAIPIPELTNEQGIALLEQALPELVAEEPAQIHTLVRAVGGLPLALKLLAHVLAAQVFTGQPRRIQTTLRRLQEAEQRLRLHLPTTPEEHPLSLNRQTPLSLQATIAISEQHLSDPARVALHALAVFPAKPNSFSEEAALAVGQMPPEILDELWDAGLLESSGPERYQLHQTIVDHAHMQGQPREAQERLVRFTLQYLQEHAQDHKALERDLNNIQAALDIAGEVSMQRDLIEVMDLLVPFLRIRGQYRLALHYLLQAYEAAMTLSNAQSQMRMLRHLVFFVARLGENQQAERFGRLGLALARQLDQPEAQCDLLTNLGKVAYRQGNYSQAITYYEQGLELARQIGASEHICTLLGRLVPIFFQQGHHVQAQQMAQEGLELAHQLGDDEIIIDMLDSMAQAAYVRGDAAQAEAFMREALERADQLGNREEQMRFRNNLATILLDRGDYKQATVSLLKAMELTRQLGHRILLCVSLVGLGEAMLIAGQYAEAEEHLLEGLELARQMDYRGLPVALTNLGETVGYQGDYKRANAYFEESVQRARQTNASEHLSAALASWGDIHMYYQHPDAAVQAYQEVLTIAATVDVNQKFTAQAHYGLARVAAQRGELAQARQLGQQSLTAYEAKSHYKAAEVRQWLQQLEEMERDAS